MKSFFTKQWLLLLSATGIFFLLSSCCGCENEYVVYDLLEEDTFTSGIEGPSVDSDGNLFAVNFREQGTIGVVDPDGNASLYMTLPAGSVGNGIRFDDKNRMYIADYKEHIIWRKNHEKGVLEVFAHEDDMNQPNDIAISPVSQIVYASDPSWSDSTGKLWMVDPEGEVSLLDGNMGTTNGIEVSPDGKLLYVNESIQRKIWVYDIDVDGVPYRKREFHSFSDFGLDGMRCDKDGNLYVTRHGKGTVLKFSPDGEILCEYLLKGKLPSNLTFSLDYSRIFVTMADRGCFEVIEFE
jgi:sugar lactone lactonase YvrE